MLRLFSCLFYCRIIFIIFVIYKISATIGNRTGRRVNSISGVLCGITVGRKIIFECRQFNWANFGRNKTVHVAVSENLLLRDLFKDSSQTNISYLAHYLSTCLSVVLRNTSKNRRSLSRSCLLCIKIYLRNCSIKKYLPR